MDDIKKYYFSQNVAADVGVDEAIMLNNIYFWVKHNERSCSDYHYYREQYWMFNTVGDFNDQYPFWTDNQIRRILKNLQDKGYIITDNFNRMRYDRTRWYSVTRKTIETLQGDTAFIRTHETI